MTRRLEHRVTPEESGNTLGWVARFICKLTRRAISRAKYLEDGILLDGLRVRTNHIVSTGQLISIEIGDTQQDVDDTFVVPKEGPLHIVYEDTDLLVINKPAGMVMHPGPGHYDDTLGNRVMAHLAKREGTWAFHPVHRLDKGTSGLCVVATSATVQHRLTTSMHTQDFRRTYLACCTAAPKMPAHTITTPIAQGEDGHSWHAAAPGEEGKRALTTYEVVGQSETLGFTLLTCTLLTGRTHQIRIHLSSIGCPLVGDELYGTASPLINRPALHSAHLELTHPITGQHLELDCPLPSDIAHLLK